MLAWDSPTSDICIIVKWMSVPLVRTPLMYPPFGNGQILGHLCWTGWRVKVLKVTYQRHGMVDMFATVSLSTHQILFVHVSISTGDLQYRKL